MWLAVALYFVLACIAVAWLALPSFRERATGWFVVSWRQATHTRSRARHLLQQRTNAAWLAGRDTTRDSLSGLRRHHRVIAIATLLLATPPLLVVALRGWHTLAAFDDRVREDNPVITALLQGEQLVPPPPLPPEGFTTP